MSESQLSLINDASVVARQPEINKMAGVAKKLVVKTAQDYQQAADYLKAIKGLLNDTESDRVRRVAPLLADQRKLNADAKVISAPLQEAERAIKRAMIDFTTEQDRIRRIEQAKADEAARKQQEKLQQQAAKAIASGKVEKAEQLEQRAAAVVPVLIQRDAPKITGVSGRENWKAECVDLRALVKAVAEGRAPLTYVTANDKVLGEQSRSLKQDFACDGVRVWSDKNLAVGAA